MSATFVPTIVDCEQRTPEWRAVRCGKITGTGAARVLAKIKKGESADRRHYREELMAERLTNIPTDHYVSREMQWGIDQEPFARAAYEVAYDVDVETCGFFIHPNIKNFGASPDGLVGTDGMIQVKCPNTSNHLAWMQAGEIPLEHAPQLLADLACSGRKWIDFVSFDPRLPAHLQLFIRRFYRDEKLISALEAEVVQFDREVDAAIGKLQPALPAPPVQPQLTESPKPFLVQKGTDPKPTYDDVDPQTGKKKFAKYAEYEAEKDAWLLRQFQVMLDRALTVPKGTVLQ